MKALLISLISTLTITSALAGPIDSPAQAQKEKASLEATVMSMNGVNGIGITGCNPKTGRKSVTGDFVYCVTIMTETKAAAISLRHLFPSGRKLNGVFIDVTNIGTIHPEPRITVGN